MSHAEADWRRLPGLLVPFGWRAFLRKHRVLLRNQGAPLTVFGQMALQLSLFSANQAGWVLDGLLARGWRDTPMRGPIFIIGHQRSGTTLLHRLLAADTTHARVLRFHEMLLPATSVQRLIGFCARTDGRLGGHLTKAFGRLQDRMFGPLDTIHRIRFNEVEEDEFVLAALYASAMCANDAPAATASPELEGLRDFHGWPPRRQAQALSWYRACLLKKLHRSVSRGDTGWIVAKNPAFTNKTRALMKVFPDARFVCLTRTPMETIPSRLSLIREIWRVRYPGRGDMSPNQVRTILADSLRTYRAMEQELPGLPPGRCLMMPYKQLVQDPAGVVQEIYQRFELPGPDQNLRDALSSHLSQPRHARPKHHYSLEEFGLTEEDINIALRAEDEPHDKAR